MTARHPFPNDIVRDDGEYSDVIHAIEQCIMADEARVAELNGNGLNKFSRPFMDQVARFKRLKDALEARYHND